MSDSLDKFDAWARRLIERMARGEPLEDCSDAVREAAARSIQRRAPSRDEWVRQLADDLVKINDR